VQRTRIKICGITRVDDARAAMAAGADAVGFVFAPSPRRVTVDQVAAIVPGLPESVEKIGVFVDVRASGKDQTRINMSPVTMLYASGARHMAQSFDATYPTIARWVQEYGWIELGQDDMSQSFVRALDEGGMVWEGQEHYPTLDAALQDLEAGLAAWMREQGL